MDATGRTKVLPPPPKPAPDDHGSDGAEGHIRCPLCHWEPHSYDRWSCTCLYSWNTFDTGGICPGCLKQWTMTACLSCGRWSPHSNWYPKD